MVAVIDYDAGNIKSVMNALIRLGEEAVLTDDPAVLRRADRVILPGVGAFGEAMEKLHARGLVSVIREIAASGKPFLGICLGQQLLFEASEETPGVEGLSLLKGTCRRIPELGQGKIPQIGWNSLAFPKDSARGSLFEGLSDGEFVYFVHSYYTDAEEKDVIKATASYGIEIPASVQKGNLMACQFHPEKSADVGMQILRNFLAMEGN